MTNESLSSMDNQGLRDKLQLVWGVIISTAESLVISSQAADDQDQWLYIQIDILFFPGRAIKCHRHDFEREFLSVNYWF